MKRSKKLLNEMKRNQFALPNVYTYNLIIQSIYLSSKPLDPTRTDAENEIMSSSGTISKNDLSKDALNFTVSTVDKYLEILTEMVKTKTKKTSPNVYTYNLILKGLSNLAIQGNGSESVNEYIIQNCMDIFLDMKRKPNIRPDVVTYSTIMRILYLTALHSKCAKTTKTINVIMELYRQYKLSFANSSNKVIDSIVMNTLSLLIGRGDADATSTALLLVKELNTPETDGK